MPGETQRRLAAIVAADVVGYSRLMGRDEAGTLAALTAQRADLLDPAIARARGRIVKTTGDGLLAEFASAVDAVACAIAIQTAVAAREADRDANQAMLWRIGVNLGDIIVEGEDIYGDGVNVAARLEGQAPAGGVLIAGNVYEQIAGKVDAAFEDAGDQSLKNIDRPVRAWRWSPAGLAETKARAGPPLPDKPSIAVLPFDNLSNDPDQEYFADGMVEEIITGLARLNWLFVIARNSSFSYKGRAVDVRQVAAELGVRYVLEGSVRKGGNRVRITGQLIDASTGSHLWADRFDGNLEDIFELQDQVTESVVGAIEPTLRHAEIARAKRKPPENLNAYDLYLRALPHAYAIQIDDNRQAGDLLEQAIALDPKYAPAAALCAWVYEQRLTSGWPTADESTPGRVIELARAALAGDSQDATSMVLAGYMLVMIARDWDTGHAAVQRALDLSPNTAMVAMFAGWAHIFAGDAALARACFERAIRLSPSDPQAFFYLAGIGTSHLVERHYAEAADYCNRAAGIYADWDGIWIFRSAAEGHLGRDDEAAKAVRKLLSLFPGASVSVYRQAFPFRDPARHEHILEGLRKAGLPE